MVFLPYIYERVENLLPSNTGDKIMIKIDKTYEVITEESAEHGGVSDSGFSAIGEEYTFRELVEAFQRLYVHPSQSPANRSGRVWFTSESEQDYMTGEYSSESIHFSRENPSRKEKYWVKAMQFAGVKLCN
jgi:hypothetical protein